MYQSYTLIVYPKPSSMATVNSGIFELYSVENLFNIIFVSETLVFQALSDYKFSIRRTTSDRLT